MKCTEKNYIDKLKKRKEEALEFIVDRYLGVVKMAVYKILNPLNKYGIIDECINDVFLAVWNNGNKFKGTDSDFKKWVYKIARFKAIDYYRKETSKLELGIYDNMAINDKTVEEYIINKENRNTLLNLIDEFDSVDKQIFIMKFFLGIKSDDIAKKFNLTRTAVDNRIYRGKKKLNKKINKLYMEEA